MKIQRLIASFFVVAFLLTAGFAFHSEGDSESRIADAPQNAVWSIDKNHSTVGFKVRHMAVANVRGEFGSFDSEVEFDPNDIGTLVVSATVDVESVDTGTERRDNHLRSPDFFDVATYPQMTFVSKEVRNIDGEDFELVGDLTIKDVTLEIVLEGEYYGFTETGRGTKAGLELEAKIDRFDYHLQWDNLTEAGNLVVGREVTILLNMELNMQE